MGLVGCEPGDVDPNCSPYESTRHSGSTMAMWRSSHRRGAEYRALSGLCCEVLPKIRGRTPAGRCSCPNYVFSKRRRHFFLRHCSYRSSAHWIGGVPIFSRCWHPHPLAYSSGSEGHRPVSIWLQLAPPGLLQSPMVVLAVGGLESLETRRQSVTEAGPVSRPRT